MRFAKLFCFGGPTDLRSTLKNNIWMLFSGIPHVTIFGMLKYAPKY